MKYKFPKVKLNEDGNFGPTENDNYYNPVFYHNKTAKKNTNKTKWVLKKNEQYEVFRLSDEGKWTCKENQGLFGILEKGNIILGKGEERLSFFPKPTNKNDAWHGFPVHSGEYEPSNKTVNKWFENDVIDNRMRIKILKGAI